MKIYRQGKILGKIMEALARGIKTGEAVRAERILKDEANKEYIGSVCLANEIRREGFGFLRKTAYDIGYSFGNRLGATRFHHYKK